MSIFGNRVVPFVQFDPIVKPADKIPDRPSCARIEFEDVVNQYIDGPVVFAICGDVSFDDCSFYLPNRDIESMLIELEPYTWFTGMVALFHVRFIGCTFNDVAIAGTKESLAGLREYWRSVQ